MELVPSSPALRFAPLDSGPVTVAEILTRRAVVTEVMNSLFRENVHFGTIPGTHAPGLWQPGAELVASVFGLAVEAHATVEAVGLHAVYTATVRLLTIAGHNFVGSATGICSTGEERFAWRAPVCEAEYVAATVKRTKFKKDEKEPIKQVGTALEDARNSAMKRAVKRALVSAIRTATACSDMFADGDEDDEDGGQARGKRKGKAEANAGQVTGAVEEIWSGAKGTWWGVKVAGTMYKSEDVAMKAVAVKAQEAGLRVALAFKLVTGSSGSWHSLVSLRAVEAPVPAAPAAGGPA